MTKPVKVWKSKALGLTEKFDSSLLSEVFDDKTKSIDTKKKPFWREELGIISKDLWSGGRLAPLEKIISNNNQNRAYPGLIDGMGDSWFDIEKKIPIQSESSKPIKFDSTKYLLSKEYMVKDKTKTIEENTIQLRNLELEVIKSKPKPVPKTDPVPQTGKKKKFKRANKDIKLKTLKFLLTPDENQVLKLREDFDMFRYYMNFSIDVFLEDREYNKKKIVSRKSYSYEWLRNLVEEYKYTEELLENQQVILRQYTKKTDDDPEGIYVPDHLKKKIKGRRRIWRGVISKLVGNINSIVTNYRAGNIKDFEIRHMSTKKPTEFIHYEDAGFPKYILGIASRYWYTTKDRRRVKISFSDVFNSTHKRGIEIIHDKLTDQYFLCYPVQSDWFPPSDKRTENQAMFAVKGKRVISLDPGVRKFLVGYDPTGSSIFIGDRACDMISELLYKIDGEHAKGQDCRSCSNCKIRSECVNCDKLKLEAKQKRANCTDCKNIKDKQSKCTKCKRLNPPGTTTYKIKCNDCDEKPTCFSCEKSRKKKYLCNTCIPLKCPNIQVVDYDLINITWTRVKNLVNDLHWKTISYLIRNYDIIIYPDFRVSGMIRGNSLPKIVKRLMTMFSTYKFKQRLAWKCSLYGKRLIIVDESWTSRTCGLCGLVKDNLGTSEVFECSRCKVPLDRDMAASRNILLKNLKLR